MKQGRPAAAQDADALVRQRRLYGAADNPLSQPAQRGEALAGVRADIGNLLMRSC